MQQPFIHNHAQFPFYVRVVCKWGLHMMTMVTGSERGTMLRLHVVIYLPYQHAEIFRGNMAALVNCMKRYTGQGFEVEHLRAPMIYHISIVTTT